jgi:uncharacterized membrane protein
MIARKNLLRSVSMFEALSGDDLDQLADAAIEHPFTPGQMIFEQGALGTSMYIIAQGTVNIHLPGDADRRVSLKDLKVGDFFGELALFDDKPRSASALAVDDVVTLELNRDLLSAYLEDHPRAAMAILRTMAERLRATDAMLHDRAAKNVDEEIEKNLSWSEVVADKVAELNGSWAFILFLLVVIVVWTVINLVLHSPFDPYPYVFFNLVLAILVALQGPLIVMSQNREGLKDRARAEIDFKVNLKNEVNIEKLIGEIQSLRKELKDSSGSEGN